MKIKLNIIILFSFFMLFFCSCKKTSLKSEEFEYCNSSRNICFYSSNKDFNSTKRLIIIDSINNIFKKNRLSFLHKKNKNFFLKFNPIENYDILFFNDNDVKYSIKQNGEIKFKISSIEKKYLDNLYLELFSNKNCKDFSAIYIRTNLPSVVGDKNRNPIPPPLDPLSNEFDANY